MKRLLSLLALITLVASSAPSRAAEIDPTKLIEPEATAADSCVAQVQAAAVQQQRIARQILLGRPDAKDEPKGNTRYGEDGSAWIKTDDNTWRSTSPGYENTTWSDLQMNRQTEWEGMNEIENPSPREPRLGQLDRRGALTSDIVPALAQMLRGYKCRLEMVCGNVRASYLDDGENPDDYKPIETPGCMDLQMKPYSQCHFDNDELIEDDEEDDAEKQRNIEAYSDTIVRENCRPLIEQLVEREKQMYLLAGFYDASYRSLLQFAGNFDEFLIAFHDDMLTPIEQSMSLLGELGRMPCFLSQCNGE